MARILIIDDDGDLRDTLMQLLLRAGHEAMAPPTGAEAARAIKAAGYDIVITDVIMPDLDGLEVVRMVRGVKPGCPIIAISGGSRRMPAEFGLSLARKIGADLVLGKPFSRERLMAAIDDLMSGRRAPVE
jgi:DNA-binding response OmpR family regulator